MAMRNANLATAMAQKCAALIGGHAGADSHLPKPLRPPHLLWMCRQIESHAASWSPAHVHRWIGFIQSAMLANRMVDLQGLKSMFDEAKRDYGAAEEDLDLLDHLDPDSFFEFEVGGQG
jgi:hypothetical protein